MPDNARRRISVLFKRALCCTYVGSQTDPNVGPNCKPFGVPPALFWTLDLGLLGYLGMIESYLGVVWAILVLSWDDLMATRIHLGALFGKLGAI